MIANQKIDVRSLLFNPFIRIAGLSSLIYGLVAIALSGSVGYMNRAHFDGVIDLHFGKEAPILVFLLEGIMNWLSLSIVLFFLGVILSKSKIRWIDVFGTQALARWPMLLLALFSFGFGTGKIAINGLSISILVFGLLSLLVVIWMVALMFNAYRISCNLQGKKLVISFIGGLISAEVISKIIIMKMVLAMTAPPTLASEAVVSIQNQSDKTEIAKKVLTHFASSEFAQIPKYFDQTMKNALPEVKLKEVWSGLNEQAGKYKNSSKLTTSKIQQYDVVYILCHFERTNLKMKAVFNDKNEIAGFFFIPENQK